MSESLWKSDEVEEAQPEQPEQPGKAESGALALSGDDFSALEERILRAVDVVKQERQARAAAEERATAAEANLASRRRWRKICKRK
jgi:hypothetical protein